MKINERTLIKHGLTGSSPDKEGYLFKRGEVNRQFQRRWIILKGNLLYYYEKKGDKEPLGLIILEGCRVEVAENETELFSFKIAFEGLGSRTYVMGTNSQESLEEWMRSLSCASYDYLRFAVAELKKQLDQLNDMERKKIVPPKDDKQVSSRFNPFNNNELLIDLGIESGEHESLNIVFSKKPFAQIHESYGIQFKDYFNHLKSNYDNPNHDLLL